MRAALGFALILATLGAGASAQTLPTEPPLTAMLELIRVKVPDARTVSDMQICPPVKISKDGTKFTVMVAFSRLNTARHFYGARVRDGRYVELMDTQLGGDTPDGLMGLAARATARQFETCRWVSPDELKAGWEAIDRR